MSISKLKRDELQQLWLAWKDRHDDNDILEAILNNKSASEEPQASITSSISDTDKAVIPCDQAVNDNCHEGRHVDKILII